jgi:hypothetical protein
VPLGRAAESTEGYAALGGGLAALGFAVGTVAGDWTALIGAAVGEAVAVTIVAVLGVGRHGGGDNVSVGRTARPPSATSEGGQQAAGDAPAASALLAPGVRTKRGTIWRD